MTPLEPRPSSEEEAKRPNKAASPEAQSSAPSSDAPHNAQDDNAELDRMTLYLKGPTAFTA